MNPTLTELLTAAAAALQAAGSDSARSDAEVLLAHALRQSRTFLRTWPEHAPAPAALAAFHELLQRRLTGEPVAYLTGHREFWSLDLAVSPATLIPRPETELLVELALERLANTRGVQAADLGTGSGAIALALASERPLARIVATDRSAAALDIARTNAAHLRLGNVEFRLGDWCAALGDEHFDLIAANPPYIASNDPHLGCGDLRFEPRSALVAAEQGLADIQCIADNALEHLKPGGWLLLEHGWDQGECVPALLRVAGYTEVHCVRDIAEQPRVSLGRKTP